MSRVETRPYFVHKDTLGSIRAITDSTQTIINSYSYDSFGNTTQTGTLSQPYAYTGRELDKETGLYYYRARYYDPVAGRFIQRDPISFAGGDVNLYGYVENNPINWIDPSGLLPKWLQDKIKKEKPWIIDNTRSTVSKICEGKLKKDELDTLTQRVLDEIGPLDAASLGDVDYWKTPLVLTADQQAVVWDVLHSISPQDVLTRKAIDLYTKAIKNGAIRGSKY